MSSSSSTTTTCDASSSPTQATVEDSVEAAATAIQHRTNAMINYAKYIIVDTPVHIAQFVGITVVVVGIGLYIKYRSAIKKSLSKLEDSMNKGLVYRDLQSKPAKVVKVLELYPEFVEKSRAEGWELCSLGEYLSTLRFFGSEDGTDPKDSSVLPDVLERELMVAMGSAILQSFGPQIGGAMLPLFGIQKVESILGQLVSTVVSWIVSNILVDVSDTGWDPIGDMACVPFNVSELTAFINLNQKTRTAHMDVSPLEWMRRGEVAYDPTYYTPPKNDVDNDNADDKDTVLIPNPFVIEEQFNAAISGLEERIRQHEEETNTTPEDGYDPNDRSLPEPKPVNPKILPGLHVGWGDAKCSHTKREILRNRLFCVLFTKLSYNYQCRKEGKTGDELFVVQMNGKKCYHPDEFFQALLDSGHTMEVCPRSAITTFGLAACVKEDDGSFTNIPLAFFLRTGYERSDQRPAYFTCPHGGVDMKIEGPLVGCDENGTSHKCNIQFYMAIEGMCGWHSNHNTVVPWIKPVSTTDVYDTKTALRAVRMSGLLACTFNAIGTEMVSCTGVTFHICVHSTSMIEMPHHSCLFV
jgi:hypothetical protein